MDNSTKIGLGLVLLVVCSAVVLYATLVPVTNALLAVVVVASLGLAAASLLLGSSEGEGRVV